MHFNGVKQIVFDIDISNITLILSSNEIRKITSGKMSSKEYNMLFDTLNIKISHLFVESLHHYSEKVQKVIHNED